MKKLFKYLFVAAAACTLAACAVKEEQPIDNGEESITFFLSDGVKAVMENNYMAWQEGDMIGWTNSRASSGGSSVVNLETNPHSFTVTNNTGTPWGTISSHKTTFYFYAPYKEGSTKNAVHFSIPTAQDGKLTNSMPLVAAPFEHTGSIKNTESASFNNNENRMIQFMGLASIAQFKVFTTNAEYGTEQVQSVNFTSDSDIAGDFTADITGVSEENLPTITGLSGKSITATLATSATVGANKAAAIDVNMSLAPGTWSGTVTVETTGATYVIPLNNVPFNRGRIRPLVVDLASPNATRTPKSSGPASPYWHTFANGDWGIGPVKDWGGWEDGYYYEQLTHPVTLDGATWDLTDAGYFEWAGTQAESGWRHGIQLGTGGMTVYSFKLTSSSFPGEITKVTLGYNSGITDGSSLTVSCKVGGFDFGSPVAHGDGDYEAEFTGSASGNIEISVSSTAKGAIYLYYVAVEYDPNSGGGADPGPACPYWHTYANGDWGIGPVKDWGGWEDGYYYEQLTHPATLDGASWNLTDAGYFEWAGTQAESGWRHGIQLGTGGMTVSSFKMTSSSFPGEITKVTLGYNSGITDGSSLTVSCKVGGIAFGTPVAHGDGDYEAEFTGSASGTIEISVSSTVNGAIYLYYVAVEYNPSSGGIDPFDSMTPAEIRAAYSPTWQDEFEGSSVNTGSNGWVFQTGGTGWGNNEIQYYVNQSVKIGGTTYNTAEVSDGTLKINSYNVPYQGKNYISARMYTKQHWKHGLIEMKAKLPTTKGCWSAFWMLPQSGSSYVRDASMDGGELDIVEYVPNDNPKNVYFSAHSYYTTKEAIDEGDFVYYPGNVDYHDSYTLSSNTTAQNDWHTYSMVWTDKYVKAYVDDNLFYTAPNPYPGQHNLPYWAFDQDYYILLNLAIGGDWGGIPAASWPNPAVFEVDYVKVYQSGY